MSQTEKVFFHEDGITVSQNQVVIHGDEMPVKNIESLSYKIIKPNKWIACALVMMGLALILDGAFLLIVGGYLIFLGLFACLMAREKYLVTLNPVAGDKRTLVSEDSFTIEKIILAINQAMATEVGRVGYYK